MVTDVAARLREAAALTLKGEPVVFACLFGSHAGSASHPRGDVDVAVLVDASISPAHHLDLRLRLANHLAGAAGLGHLEVHVLNELPRPVRGRAVRDRLVIYSRDQPTRVQYEARTMDDLMDFETHSRSQTQKLDR